MFSLAYMILPFSEIAPADAIWASLARFQRGLRGHIPDDWISFDDDTNELRQAYETRFTFTGNAKDGLRIEGGIEALWFVDGSKVLDEMRRRGLQSWHVRFADIMTLDTFFDCFCRYLERDPVSGGYGRWLNPLGRLDWWDLGGRFDGYIIGEPSRGAGRGVSQVSSGQNPGRAILSISRTCSAQPLIKRLCKRSTCEATGTSSSPQPCSRIYRLAGRMPAPERLSCRLARSRTACVGWIPGRSWVRRRPSPGLART